MTQTGDTGGTEATGADAPGTMREQQTVPCDDIAVLAERVRGLVGGDGARVMLGLAGPPGAGKSTLAERLARALAPYSAVVPLDGFHLSNAVLRRTGRASRKGAIDTFDAEGYRALLARLRARDEEAVYAPSYSRALEECVAAAILVSREVRFVITEGNYLLADGAEWCRVRALLDSVWYVEADERLRLERLIGRHMRFGRDREAATGWAAGSDEVNACLVRFTRHRADLVVRPA